MSDYKFRILDDSDILVLMHPDLRPSESMYISTECHTLFKTSDYAPLWKNQQTIRVLTFGERNDFKDIIEIDTMLAEKLGPIEKIKFINQIKQ